MEAERKLVRGSIVIRVLEDSSSSCLTMVAIVLMVSMSDCESEGTGS
jgi:hypothetical protein